jgi:NADH-quinone oxidoreductase subunit E
MSGRSFFAVEQPASFAFTPENQKRAEEWIAKYPPGRQASAIIPLFHLVQEQHDGWLPRPAMDHVADMLQMPRIKAYEVATFYSMYNLAPVGKHVIEVCTTTPCWLRGSADIVNACSKRLGIKLNETTADKQFTLREVECLGACVNAPMIQIGEHYYEDLTPESMTTIIDDLAAGRELKPGSQTRKYGSMNAAGTTTLVDRARQCGVPVAQGVG